MTKEYEKVRKIYTRNESMRAAVPTTPPPAQVAANECPGSIIDQAPDGSGLGVWVLVDSDGESCTYEYNGGIA